MKRNEARELAFKTIYSRFFNPSIELDEEITGFAENVINSYIQHTEEVNEAISSKLKGYTLDRLYKIDLAIIILAVVEVRYLETPKPVAINEAVELAKKYSTDKSPKFINGLLAEILN